MFARCLTEWVTPAAVAVTMMVLTGCKPPPSNLLQGYIEGEFVYVSAPAAGKLAKLKVHRGQQVKVGQALFELEDTAEQAARDEAAHRLQQAKATLEDAKKGKRPTEIDSLRAQLKQAHEALALAEIDFKRQDELIKSGAVSADAADRARSMRLQSQQHVEQLEADIKTAQLGMREDAVAALGAEVQARQAALQRAEWDLSQKQQSAPAGGEITDTLYREGESVAASRPVVVLLPPGNVKARVFVPESKIATLHVGDAMNMRIDGVNDAVPATISFISPQAEYTPPVIYSQENRSKLVFMIELRFAPDIATKLHPGQPVDVLP